MSSGWESLHGVGVPALFLTSAVVAFWVYERLQRCLAHRRKVKELERQLDSLWQHREQVNYHVHWARDRGDLDESNALRKEIKSIDRDIRALQAHLERIDGPGTFVNAKSHRKGN